MAKTRGDTQTFDLLSWEPPEVVRRYDEEIVRASTLKARISHAVSQTLKESGLSREDIARAMTEWLGEDVGKNILDAYASEAREDHTITYLRLLALIHVTGDVRLLQIGAELFDHVVAHSRYLGWIKVGMEADRRDRARQITEETDREFELALRAARRGGKS